MSTQPGQRRQRLPIFRLLSIALFAGVLLSVAGANLWSILTYPRWGRVTLGLPQSWGEGWDVDQIRSRRGLPVNGIDPQGPAALAGIRPGDTVVEVNGESVGDRPEVYYRVLLDGHPGDSVSLGWVSNGIPFRARVALRPHLASAGRASAGGEGLVVNLGPHQFRIRSSAAAAWFACGPGLAVYLLALLIGLAVGLPRLRDPIAWQFSLAFLSLGLLLANTGAPLAVLWPRWVWALVLGSVLPYGVAVLLFLRVLAVFPVPTRLGRLALRWQWLVFLLFSLWGIGVAASDLSDLFDSVRPVHQALRFLNAPMWVPMAACLPLLIVLLVAQHLELRRLPHRRFRMFVLGFAIMALGAVINVVGPLLPWPRQGMVLTVLRWLLNWFIPMAILALGSALVTYSVVAQRLFGLRFAIRRGLQHLLLSRTVLTIEALIVFVLLLEALRRGGSALAGSVPLVAAVSMGTSLAVMTGLRRLNRPLMNLIDRRFFSETYDARRVLLGLGQQMSNLTDRNEILERAAQAVMRTLHPSRIAFFLRDPQGGSVQPALQRTQGRGRGMELDGAAQATDDGFLEGDSSRVRETLAPFAEGRDWVVFPPERQAPDGPPPPVNHAPLELLVAIRSGSDLRGCMALAAKLSEEPYSGEDRELLQAVTTQMGLALRNAELVEVARREAQQARDLEIARNVQQTLFPADLPRASGWEFAACCRPAREVGGDYYDLFEIAPGRIAIGLGDVSGKGLGASLMMAGLHAMIRGRLPRQAEDLAGLAAEINEYLVASTPVGMFITLFLGVLNVESGQLRFVNGGHPPPVLLRAGGDEPTLLEASGTIVGILPGATFEEGNVALDAGALLVIYSDGVTEATNAGSEMFEETGVLRTLQAAPQLGASQALHNLLDSVDQFVAGAEQADDISLIVVRRGSGPATAPGGTCQEVESRHAG